MPFTIFRPEDGILERPDSPKILFLTEIAERTPLPTVTRICILLYIHILGFFQINPLLHSSLFSLKGQNLQPLSEGFGS